MLTFQSRSFREITGFSSFEGREALTYALHVTKTTLHHQLHTHANIIMSIDLELLETFFLLRNLTAVHSISILHSVFSHFYILTFSGIWSVVWAKILNKRWRDIEKVFNNPLASNLELTVFVKIRVGKVQTYNWPRSSPKFHFAVSLQTVSLQTPMNYFHKETWRSFWQWRTAQGVSVWMDLKWWLHEFLWMSMPFSDI